MATRALLSRTLKMPSPRRVAVIGAGPAGLSAADQLATLSPSSFAITLFDRRATFGGVWCYDADPGECVIRFDASGRAHPLWSGGRKDGADHGKFRPPGAMYDGLRTNLPCDVMAYRSQPFGPGTALFSDRAAVESYIAGFAQRVLSGGGVDVLLGTAVQDVRRIAHDEEAAKERIGGGSLWSVTSINVESGKTSVEKFDHVVLASGRCNTPTIPRVRGLQSFRGQILHSAWYRSPLPFEGKTVLVVGNSSSGSDIARELSGYVLRTLPEGETATTAFKDRCSKGREGKVLHSYEHIDKPPPLDFDPREPDSPAWAKRITVVPRIREITPDGSVVFDTGERRDDIDVLIFGTGYAYDFPYLDQQLAPFAEWPLIPLPPPPTAAQDEAQNSAVGTYEPPHRTAPFLTHLDDWSLFYSPDPSICVLGAPVRIVPMPLTHVQSRIVAAAWAGLLPRAENSKGLPRLDPGIPTTDPAKWTSRATTPLADDVDAGNKTSDLGYPSDSAYQDALLNLLPAHLRPEGTDETSKVPDQETGNSELPVTATDEGWSRMPDYRNQRRQDTKRLRRLLLGY